MPEKQRSRKENLIWGLLIVAGALLGAVIGAMAGLLLGLVIGSLIGGPAGAMVGAAIGASVGAAIGASTAGYGFYKSYYEKSKARSADPSVDTVDETSEPEKSPPSVPSPLAEPFIKANNSAIRVEKEPGNQPDNAPQLDPARKKKFEEHLNGLGEKLLARRDTYRATKPSSLSPAEMEQNFFETEMQLAFQHKAANSQYPNLPEWHSFNDTDRAALRESWDSKMRELGVEVIADSKPSSKKLGSP